MARKVKLVAVVRDSAGNRIHNAHVAFEYMELGKPWYYLGSRYTDSNGVAEMVITLNPGVYSFRARFTGTKYYRESFHKIEEFVVKDKTVITLTIQPL
jgi:hypothetical protein